MEKETTVLVSQSWLDLAIQTGGSLEAAFDLAVSNNISLTDEPEVGQKILNPQPVNAQVCNYYRKKKITPATGIDLDETSEGIEFWRIERDFIVS